MNETIIIYCIDEGGYESHITKRKSYELVKIGEGTKEGKVRIKNNQQKLVWIPEECFTNKAIPDLVSISIDDQIDNELNSCIEVTITFSNGQKYWTTFMTVNYLNKKLLENRDFITGDKLILTKQVNKDIIDKTINELDRTNKLRVQLNAY